jgi:hypothetical protein
MPRKSRLAREAQPVKLVVVSTGVSSPHKARCLASVRAQQLGGDDSMTASHVYFEASEQSPLLGKTENFYRLVHALAPTDVVVALDGDDWLAHDRVLLRVREMHEAGAWLTFGSFVMAPDDEIFRGPIVYQNPATVFTCPYEPGTDYRRASWRASHLKTFRAGLFQRIKREDFQHEGQWLFTTDVAMMFPMLEMAGPKRTKRCPEVLYVYNWSVSNERSGSQEQKNIEKHHGELCRAKTPYAELPSDLDEAP